MAPLSYWHDSLEAERRPAAAAAAGRETPTSTSPSSAPASRASGPRTTCCGPTRSLRVDGASSARSAGFGASGRNGGWCVGDRPRRCRRWRRRPAATPPSRWSTRCTTPWTRSATSVEREGIDCGFAKGGAIRLATGRQQLRSSRAPPRGPGPRTASATTTRCSRPRETAEIVRRRGRPRRHVHAARRRAAPRSPRAGTGRWPSSGSAASCTREPRRRRSSRAGCRTDHGTVRAPRWSCGPPRPTRPASRATSGPCSRWGTS